MFPLLANRRFVPICLEDVALDFVCRSGVEHERPLSPEVCAKALDEAHQATSADFSYGGWLEDRAELWRGTYLDAAGTHLHLGIDINVPAGTLVSVDWPAIVLRVDCDAPEEHGWGTRIIVQPRATDVVLVYAHLAPKPFVTVGSILHKGEGIGVVGWPGVETNGGWYPHLHVQAIRLDHYQKLLVNDLQDLDGYGSAQDQEELAQVFPDPSPWIKIP